mmetsp:Transcript_23535/g.50298  ORF Transcript_23535/g.50298 Transcript_23535/m.50298 type:complete len:575 (-) Transcript_23535:234-1958(-)
MESVTDPFGDGFKDKGKYYPQVVMNTKKLLQDDTYSDVIIKVGSDALHAHAAIICSRCPEIVGPPAMDEKSKKKTKKMEVKIKDGSINASSMNKILEFLYTGMVDFPKISDKEILLLVKAARFFKLDRLSYLCERWLNEHMTIESVFHLLKAATDLSEDRIRGFCMQFALKNYNDFIANKDGIYILGIELFQEVVAAFQTNPAPPAAIYPEGGPPDTLLDDFKNMFDNMPYSDFFVTCGSENIKCHKAMLSAYSENLSSLIKDPETPVRLSGEAFKSLLKFSYYGYDQVEPLPACDLVGFCRTKKLPVLLRICEDKIRNSINEKTVLHILGVSYLPAGDKQDLVDELQSKCFPFILDNLDKVDLSMAKAFNPLMTIDLLLQLQTACKQNKHGLGCILNVDSGASAAKAGSAPKKGTPAAPPRRNVQPPPPASVLTNSGGAPPSPVTNRPAPPPRNTSGSGNGLPPPVIGGGGPSNVPPPAPVRADRQPSNTSFPPPPLTTQVSSSELREDGEKGRLNRKKSEKNVRADVKPKLSKKDKKEEEKRKKEEAKRIAKEKKERQKMEKKFKGGKGEIF